VKLLVLGGTRFLGRVLVEDALERGHELTLFNRGRTNPELFPEAKKIRGDRTETLERLAGSHWDAVVDVATFIPRVVRLSVDALRGHVDRYVYISSVSVYADQSVPPVEGARVAELEDPDDESIESYGALKAVCEQIVQAAFGEQALVVRPGLIVGRHDPTDRFTYWPVRVAEGGHVLAPGTPDDPVQFIDVRDLASWILDAIERGLGGVYNATREPMPFGEFLEACRGATGGDAEFSWVPSERLVAEGVEEWMGIPLWIASVDWQAANRVVVDKAIAAGLRFRPVEETILDTLGWHRQREWPAAEGVGLTRERERELLVGA
jgi:2'-hydroxyisoflavone reductase